MSTAPPDDLLDALAGLSPDQAEALRAHRPSAVRAAQASYDSLFPADLATDAVPAFGLDERALAAARVAVLEQFTPAADHYLSMLDDSARALATGGADAAEARGCSRRARAVVRHTDLLVTRPAAASPSDLGALQAAGLSEADIVVLGQVVGFVSFQVRTAHGLAVLKEQL
jgi:CMD domain protein